MTIILAVSAIVLTLAGFAQATSSVSNTPNSRLAQVETAKDYWDKAEIVGGFFVSIAVGFAGYWIGRRQNQVANDQLHNEGARLRLELFEKRLTVFQNVQKFFDSLPPISDGSAVDRLAMKEAIVMARFLFPRDVAACLEQALMDSWRLKDDALTDAMKDHYLKSRDHFIREMNFEEWLKSRR